MTSVRESLTAYPFLDELPEPWLDRLAGLGEQVTYRIGHRVFAEGDRAEHFWFIGSGAVDLDLELPGRGNVVIDTLGPGSVLGWSWMFPPYRWHFGAVATAHTTHTIRFAAVEVLRLLHENPVQGLELTRRFMGLAVRRLQATRLRLANQEVPG